MDCYYEMFHQGTLGKYARALLTIRHFHPRIKFEGQAESTLTVVGNAKGEAR